MIINFIFMFNWFKKKPIPLEDRHADALEALLDNESVNPMAKYTEDELVAIVGGIDVDAIRRESAPGSETPGHPQNQEAEESEPTDVEQEVIQQLRIHCTCCGLEGKLRRDRLFGAKYGLVPLIPTTQTNSPPTNLEKQTSLRKKVTPQGIRISMEPGRKYKVHAPQTGSGILAASEGKGTSDVAFVRKMRAKMPDWYYDQDTHTESPPHS